MIARPLPESAATNQGSNRQPLSELIARVARALNVSLQDAERIVLSALHPRAVEKLRDWAAKAEVQ
jgi:hypothetical protein